MHAPAPTSSPLSSPSSIAPVLRPSCLRPGRSLARLAAPLIVALALAAVCGLVGVAAEEDPVTLVLAPVPTATPPSPEGPGVLTLVEADATAEPDDPVLPPDNGEPAVEEIIAVEEVAPGPGNDDITVEIRERVCPTDVTAIADDIAALTVACPAPATGLTALLNQEGVTTPSFTDASGAASWADLVLGQVYLGLNLPPESGMPIVFCRDDLPGSDWARYSVTGSTDQAGIAAELTVPGAWFICSWYIPPAPRSMTIQAWSCPDNLLATNEDVADFLDACTAPIDGLGFRLDAGTGVQERQTAGGTAIWEDLPLTPVQIEAGDPEGFGQPAVFCASDGSVAFAPYPAPLNTMEYDFTAIPGPNALCHWFMIPDQGSVTIYKRVCQLGVDASSEDPDYFGDKCQENLGGEVVFHLLKGELDQPQIYEKETGWISWDKIGSGTATIWEEIPAGFVQPVVFCTAATEPFPALITWDLIPTNQGRIELPFGETYLHYSCNWFNIPGDPNNNDGWLDLTTYACPAGAIADASTADAATFAAACPSTEDEIPVTLDLGDGHAPFVATTGEAGPGRVFFPLPDGTYSEVTLSEDLPAEVVDYALFCRKSGPASEPDDEDESDGFTVWLDLEPGSTWLCDWYNMLAADGGDDGGSDSGTDDNSSGADGGADGPDAGADSSTGSWVEPDVPLVVTLPDTGAGSGPDTHSAPMTWVWSLVALAGAMGLALEPGPAAATDLTLYPHSWPTRWTEKSRACSSRRSPSSQRWERGLGGEGGRRVGGPRRHLRIRSAGFGGEEVGEEGAEEAGVAAVGVEPEGNPERGAGGPPLDQVSLDWASAVVVGVERGRPLRWRDVPPEEEGEVAQGVGKGDRVPVDEVDPVGGDQQVVQVGVAVGRDHGGVREIPGAGEEPGNCLKDGRLAELRRGGGCQAGLDPVELVGEVGGKGPRAGREQRVTEGCVGVVSAHQADDGVCVDPHPGSVSGLRGDPLLKQKRLAEPFARRHDWGSDADLGQPGDGAEIGGNLKEETAVAARGEVGRSHCARLGGDHRPFATHVLPQQIVRGEAVYRHAGSLCEVRLKNPA